MKLPNINPKHRWYEYWKDSGVHNGTADPDEWQSALISLVEQALAQGVFYTSDMMEYVKKHADFIPSEWWSYQYSGTPVEGGIMGMEVYCARNALEARKEREVNAEAFKTLVEGQKLGTLSVNHKRVNKCVIKSLSFPSVTVAGVLGRYECEFTTEARYISAMIERAASRGWRKS